MHFGASLDHPVIESHACFLCRDDASESAVLIGGAENMSSPGLRGFLVVGRGIT